VKIASNTVSNLFNVFLGLHAVI